MNSDFLTQHCRWILATGITIGIILSFAFAHHQIITGDQWQMLQKGYLAAHDGVWLAYGNAASAVGNVPGYLSTLVIGAPLLLWDNPWSPMIFLILIRLVSYILFDAVIKQIFDAPIRILFMVIYLLNPWFQYDNLLYNPAYLCFFMALHFWTAFQLREKSHFGYSVLHVLAIGGAMQLHYSWPILAVISCFLLYRKMAIPDWRGVFTAGALIGFSLIPYAIEMMQNESIGRESDRYIGYGAVHVYPVLKAVIYWLRYASTLFSNRIITDVGFDWVSSLVWVQLTVQYIWQSILFLVGAATVLFSAKANWIGWKQVKSHLKRGTPVQDDQQWLLLFAAATVFAIIINAMLSPITFSYWHLIITFPIALIPFLLFANDWKINQFKKFQWSLLGLSVFFIVVNLVVSHDSNKFSYQVTYEAQVSESLKKDPGSI